MFPEISFDHFPGDIHLVQFYTEFEQMTLSVYDVVILGPMPELYIPKKLPERAPVGPNRNNSLTTTFQTYFLNALLKSETGKLIAIIAPDHEKYKDHLSKDISDFPLFLNDTERKLAGTLAFKSIFSQPQTLKPPKIVYENSFASFLGLKPWYDKNPLSWLESDLPDKKCIFYNYRKKHKFSLPHNAIQLQGSKRA